MAPVRVHDPGHGLVALDQVTGQRLPSQHGDGAVFAFAYKADRAHRCGPADRLAEQGAATLQHGVKFAWESGRGGVVGGPQSSHQVGLGAVVPLVHYVHVVAASGPQHGRQQPDRPGAEHQGPARPAPGEQVQPLPRLGHDAGRFQEQPGQAQPRVDAYGLVGRQPEPFGPEAVFGHDAALGETAVLAQVGLTAGAERAGEGVSATHDAHHQVALMEPGAGGSLQRPAQGLMADDEAVAPRR